MATLKDAQKAANEIIKILNSVSVVVFGSVAKHGKGNDLDLLVITDGLLEWEEENHLLYKSLEKCREKLMYLFIKYYSEGSPFLELITREGMILYMKKAVDEWIKQSKEDLDTAEYLIRLLSVKD